MKYQLFEQELDGELWLVGWLGDDPVDYDSLGLKAESKRFILQRQKLKPDLWKVRESKELNEPNHENIR